MIITRIYGNNKHWKVQSKKGKNMENIDITKNKQKGTVKKDIITEEEATALREVRSLEALVFLHYKYRRNYKITKYFSSCLYQNSKYCYRALNVVYIHRNIRYGHVASRV